MTAGGWLYALSEATTEAERDGVVLAMNVAMLPIDLWRAVEAAAVPHWFNILFLDALLGKESDLLYEELLKLSFVEQIPGRGYAIHERTRNLLLDQLWRNNPDRFRQLSEFAADHCAQQAALTENIEWQAEEIYHRMISNPRAGVDGLRALATKWANYEYHTYEEIEYIVQLASEHINAGRLSGEGAAWTRLWQARLALIFGRPELAPAALDQITLDSDDDLVLSAEVAQVRGDILAQLGDELGMHMAWSEAYEGYNQLPDGSGRLDAFLVAEKMRAAGFPDPQVDKVSDKPPTPPRVGALRLIDNIKYAWIEGVLNKSVDESLKLHMSHSGGLTSNLVFHKPQGIDRPVTSGRLSRLFAAAGGSMLILGAPGSGKTITLLQLLEELLNKARIDGDAPIPLLFNLSSFRNYVQENEADLTGWVAEQAYKQYRLKRETTREQLVAGRAITLLLDGLDEVPLAERKTCVAAINKFVETYPSDLVVCSRISDYQELDEQLALNHALVLQPLSNGQIDTAIDQQPEPERSQMLAQIQADWQLREALRSPLMLSRYPQAFPALDTSDWSANDTVEARRQFLFAAFVDAVLTQSASNTMPSGEEETFKSQNKGRLTFLAGRIQDTGTTLFYVEDLQPQWLPEKMLHRFRGIYGLILGLLFGLCFALVFWSSLGLSAGLASVLAMPAATVLTTRIRRPLMQSIVGAVVYWLIFELLGELIFVLLTRQDFGKFDGLIIGLGAIISAGIASQAIDIQLREKVKIIRPPLPRLFAQFKRGILYGLLGGLVIGLLSGVFDSIDEPFILTLRRGLIGGLIGLFVGPLICLILSFLNTPSVDDRPDPGQGVDFSIRNAVALTALFGLIFVLPVWYFELSTGSGNLDNTHLLLANILPLSFTWFGGLAWIQHIALRIMFASNDWLPLHLIAWLDDMAVLGLLRRVGGGYIFIHRSLLEYFAALAESL